MKKVFDRRRLCTEADLFQTRKSGKTELGAALDFAQFMFMGDANEQVSIVANDANQAIKIAFKAVKAYAMQIDPSAKNKLGGKLRRLEQNNQKKLNRVRVLMPEYNGKVSMTEHV